MNLLRYLGMLLNKFQKIISTLIFIYKICTSLIPYMYINIHTSGYYVCIYIYIYIYIYI
jgi:hypothetical protein